MKKKQAKNETAKNRRERAVLSACHVYCLSKIDRARAKGEAIKKLIEAINLIVVPPNK